MSFPDSYIYIEASSPRVKGDKAIIEAGPFKADQNFCFTFYYHMFGVHIGRLSVYQAWSNRTNIELLWTRNTSGDGSWKTSSLDVRSRNNFYVSITEWTENFTPYLQKIINYVVNKLFLI